MVSSGMSPWNHSHVELSNHRFSVTSSQWGHYKGTLIGVSHLDLINWTNRMKWWFWSLTGKKRK